MFFLSSYLARQAYMKSARFTAFMGYSKVNIMKVKGKGGDNDLPLL
jgi:hypothetical protein